MTSSITTTQDLHDLTVAQLARHLRERKVSAVETAQHFLKRAQAHTSLGSFVDVNADVTLAQARAADERIASGNPGALEGVPIAHKDIFVTKDFCSTAGSKMLAGYRSPFDATVVAKLAGQGMVTLGKLNCDEFAMGSSNENSAVAPVGFSQPHPVGNPWDTSRIPGGSSGGSAAAVAPGSRPWLPAPTLAAPFASRLLFVASQASNPRMDVPPATAWWRLPPASIRRGRWHARPKTALSY